jgi:transcriptional regulator with XRE-family HTH domain
VIVPALMPLFVVELASSEAAIKGVLTLMAYSQFFRLPMSFPERPSAYRKQSGLTQQQIADKIGMHVSQYKRYEAGTSQPTIEVFRRIALALSVTADTLLFEENEGGPDERLKLQFEAVSRLDPKEREAIETVIAASCTCMTPSDGHSLPLHRLRLRRSPASEAAKEGSNAAP